MKLFQQLLVAPAALGLLAPVAANAAELNINGVSEYTGASEQVTSVTQFSDVYPTDWAYQALSNLVERYGCVAGYPNGTFRGNRAMTRYEAAALLNACLDRITEVTDELKRLMKEFERELAILKGRVDGLEARVGELEATQFSTTTKLKGKTTFVIGATQAGGTNPEKYIQREGVNLYTVDFRRNADGSGEYFRYTRGELVSDAARDQAIRRVNPNTRFTDDGRNGGANAYNRRFGAATFNYDQRLAFVTSFTGKDKLFARLRAGNFDNTPFGGDGVNLTALDVNSGGANNIALDRLYYKFPVGKEFTVIVGALARNTESLGAKYSMYNKGGAKILDVTGLMGASGVYNKQTGQLIGGYWKQKVAKGDNRFSVSLNYVADDGQGNNADSEAGGFMTSNSEGSVTAQIGYTGPQWGIVAGYRYGQCDSDDFRRSTEFADGANNVCANDRFKTYTVTDAAGNSKKFYLPEIDQKLTEGEATVQFKEGKRTGSSTNSFALNAYWQPEESGWIPSVSAGWSINTVDSTYKAPGSPIETQSWMVGLKWDDVLLKGNAMGFAFGQPTFATSTKSCPAGSKVFVSTTGNAYNNQSKCGDTAFDGNYVFEWYYNFQVTDNIAITPSVFYLSRPLGQNTRNLIQGGEGYDGEFNVFGGLVQTTFKF